MMWAEAAFSSLLVLSALYLAASIPQPSSGISVFVSYQHLNDASVLVSQAIHDSESGAAQSTSFFVVQSAQSALDASTKNSPYCREVEFDAASDSSVGAIFPSVASCSGSALVPQSASSAPTQFTSTSQLSVSGEVWHNGNLLHYKIRQWTNIGK